MEFIGGENRAVFYISLRYKVQLLSDILAKAIPDKKRVVHLTSACLPSDLRFFLASMGSDMKSGASIEILSALDIFFGDGALNLKRAKDIIKNDLLKESDLISIDYSWAGSEQSLFNNIFQFDADMHTFANESKTETLCFFNLRTFSDSHAVEIAKVHSSSSFESSPDEKLSLLYNSFSYHPLSIANEGSNLHLFEAVKVEIEELALSCGVSAQEKRVLEMMLKFKANKVIAHELFISDNTLKQHLKAIYRKLSVDTRLCLYEKFYGHLLENSTIQL